MSKKINALFFLPSFFLLIIHVFVLFVNKIFVKNVHYSNFFPPLSKLYFPVRIQTLIKPSSSSIENKKENIKNQIYKQKQFVMIVYRLI